MATESKVCEGCKEAGSDRCNTESCSRNNVLPQSEMNDIKNVLAVMSGKGGVGKSSISGLLAVTLARRGFRVGILDADITGPSIPKMFGLKERPDATEQAIYPVKTPVLGIEVISLNLLLPNEDDPVVWRGPLLAGAVKQFWTDVAWGSLDYLIVDLPPGTGDVPLTVMQSLPLNGLIIVTSPQDLTNMVVKKAIKMARQMGVPILGMIENMSYLACPSCGEKIRLFGPSHGEEVARSMGILLLDVLPIDPELAALCDSGQIENYQKDIMKDFPFFHS